MATSQQVALDPVKKKVDSLRQLLLANAGEVRKVLPKSLDLERFQRIVINSALRTPALLDCTPQSMILAVQEAATRGLEPDGVMGFLIPYGKVAQFLPHWRGLVHVVRCEGDITKFVVRAVFEGDEFDYEYGLNERCAHRPLVDLDDPEKPPRLTHVYAIAWSKNGDVQFDVMYRHDIERIRARSKSGNNGPWVTDYVEMAKKTVVKRLCKVLPISVEARDFIDRDNRIERGEVIDTTLVEQAAAIEKPKSKLDAVVAARKQEAPATSEVAEEYAPGSYAPVVEKPLDPFMHQEPTGPDVNTLKARALMGEEAAIDELHSMGMQPGALAEINLDKLPKDVAQRYRAWLSPPKKGA